MLAGVLHSEKAVRISIVIMNAFIAILYSDKEGGGR